MKANSELTEKVAHAAGLEVKGCVDPTDEIGGGFEAERRPVECALLPLIHADEVDRSHFPQVVSGGHPENGGGSNGKYPLLLEPRRDLCGARSEEGVRVEKGDLAELIGDGVVRSPLQVPSAQQELFTSFPDLQGAQTQSRPVT